MNNYTPDYVSPPGDTLQEVLNTLNISIETLSEKSGISQPNLQGILKGEIPIKQEQAAGLEKALGLSAQFWLNRESHYRQSLNTVNFEGKASRIYESGENNCFFVVDDRTNAFK